MSFGSSMRSYVRYHTNRAAYAEIQKQKREKQARDAYAQSFYTLRRDYDHGTKTAVQVEKVLIKQLEAVWMEQNQLALTYNHIQGAGLTSILPREYRPDFAKYGEDTRTEVKEFIATKEAGNNNFFDLFVGLFLIGITIPVFERFISQGVADTMLLVGFGLLIAWFYYGPTLTERTERISDEDIEGLVPEVSFYYVPIFRQRAEQAQRTNRIKVDRDSHTYNTNPVGDFVAKRL